jgi:hypothetical protein
VRPCWRGRARWLPVLAAIAVHGPSLAFGFTYLDDRDLIVDDHAFLARPASLYRAFGRAYMHVVDRGHAYYRPLVTASYALDAQWSGVRPLGYHATNVVLHAIASALFLAWIRRFLFPSAVAIGAALVFALHPALAAAVAWIPGRNDSLLGIFGLAAWLFFLRDRDHRSPVDRALHFVFFALALLTKETAVVLPLVWTVEAAIVGRERWRGLRETRAIVYFAGWTACVFAIVVAHRALEDGPSDLRLLSLFRNLPVLAASFGKIAVPFSPTALAVPADLSPWPGVLAAGGLAVATRFVPGVRARIVAFGLAAFVLLLAPVLATPGTLVLDNRLYLPACGAILAIAEVVRAAAFEQTEPAVAKLVAVLTGFTVVLLGVVTAAYEQSFRDRRAFAREAVAASPHSALAHFCLGQTYQIDGDTDRALAEYRISLELSPGEVVHNNIAVIYMKSARWPEAESELREEIADNPRYARAYENLAIVLRREGRQDEAQAAADKARDLARE